MEADGLEMVTGVVQLQSRYKKFQEKDGVLVFKCGISIQVADDNSGTLYIDAENVRSYRSETHREADTQVYEKGCFNK